MQAVSYIRGSTDRHDLKSQSEHTRKYAAKRELSIDREFVEMPGTEDVIDRPAWNDMLAHCDQHEISTILVAGYERVSRRFIVGLTLVRACRDSGVRIIDCSNGIELTTKEPYATFAVSTMFSLSEFVQDTQAENAKVAL